MTGTQNKKLFMVCLNGTTHFVQQTDDELVRWSGSFDHKENGLTMSKVNVMSLDELSDLFVV